MKPLYESVAQHHPDRGVLSGAPEVIPFGVNFAGQLSDSALGFLYRLASIKYPKKQKRPQKIKFEKHLVGKNIKTENIGKKELAATPYHRINSFFKSFIL